MECIATHIMTVNIILTADIFGAHTHTHKKKRKPKDQILSSAVLEIEVKPSHFVSNIIGW